MEEIKNKAPVACESNKGLNNNNIALDSINNLASEMPDDFPGCYLEYRGWDDCIACLYRLPCARTSAGGQE